MRQSAARAKAGLVVILDARRLRVCENSKNRMRADQLRMRRLHERLERI